MTLCKRGKYWWFELVHKGIRYRETTGYEHTDKGRSTNKPLAQLAQDAFVERLKNASNGIKPKQKVLHFAVAAQQWLEANAHWSESTREIYESKAKHLNPVFGKRLLVEITEGDISAYQFKRLRAGASGRQINMELSVLRMILRKHKLWHLLASEYKPMRESENVGKALSEDEETRLLEAARKSRSLSLHPALVVLINTGLRVSELRTMKWDQVDILGQSVTVGLSKTRGGEGRLIPLNETAFDVLVRWRQRFSDVRPEHYVFPSERYGLKGEDGHKLGTVAVWDRDPERPIGSWKVSWGACRKLAQVDCRLHDLRHTFVSRLGAKQVSDQTVKALAGHMSVKMMERYSHAQNKAKRQAVEGLSPRRVN